MSPVTPDFAARYAAAWAAHDPDAIIAMHTDDTVFAIYGLAEPAVGRDAVRDMIAALFTRSPDLHFEPRREHLGADHFVSEYEVSSTVNGSHFACAGVDVFTIRDGLIARKDTYIDSSGYRRQLGTDVGASGR